MIKLGEVLPRKGIGNILLGETKEATLSILGKPKREANRKRNRTDLTYDGFCLIFNADQILEVIEVYPESEITYKGLSIFGGQEAWKQLIADEPEPLCLSGTIVLPSLGVSMWQDPDEEEQDKSFVISMDGVWDRLSEKLKPYKE